MSRKTSLKKQYLKLTEGGRQLDRDQFESRSDWRRYMRDTVASVHRATDNANRKAAKRDLHERQQHTPPTNRFAAMTAVSKLSRVQRDGRQQSGKIARRFGKRT